MSNKKKYKKLKGIDPKKFLSQDYGIFFSLALISNDLGDLINLQSLHAKNSGKPRNYISAEMGRKTGRGIYIFRLALSHLYEFFKFLNKNKKDIENDQNLKNIIDKNLSVNDKFIWEFVIKLSENQKFFGKRELSIVGVKSEFIKVLNLTEIARNNVTFHYYGTTGHLKNGFRLAFKNGDEDNTKFAFVTETNNIYENRNYYIDLAMQRFLESRIDLKKDNLGAVEEVMVGFLADLNRIIYKILCGFHEQLGFENLNK